MYYKLYTRTDRAPFCTSNKAKLWRAINALPIGTRYGVLESLGKYQFPHAGFNTTRATSLVYPKGSSCKQYTPEEWIREVLTAE